MRRPARYAADPQVAFVVGFHGVGAQRLQAVDLVVGEGQVPEVGKRGTAPQRQGLAERIACAGGIARLEQPLALTDLGFEHPGVQSIGAQAQSVAVTVGDQSIGAVPVPGLLGQDLAQVRYVGPQRRDRFGRRGAVPDLFDQCVDVDSADSSSTASTARCRNPPGLRV